MRLSTNAVGTLEQPSLLDRAGPLLLWLFVMSFALGDTTQPLVEGEELCA